MNERFRPLFGSHGNDHVVTTLWSVFFVTVGVERVPLSPEQHRN